MNHYSTYIFLTVIPLFFILRRHYKFRKWLSKSRRRITVIRCLCAAISCYLIAYPLIVGSPYSKVESDSVNSALYNRLYLPPAEGLQSVPLFGAETKAKANAKVSGLKYTQPVDIKEMRFYYNLVYFECATILPVFVSSGEFTPEPGNTNGELNGLISLFDGYDVHGADQHRYASMFKFKNFQWFISGNRYNGHKTGEMGDVDETTRVFASLQNSIGWHEDLTRQIEVSYKGNIKWNAILDSKNIQYSTDSFCQIVTGSKLVALLSVVMVPAKGKVRTQSIRDYMADNFDVLEYWFDKNFSVQDFREGYHYLLPYVLERDSFWDGRIKKNYYSSDSDYRIFWEYQFFSITLAAVFAVLAVNFSLRKLFSWRLPLALVVVVAVIALHNNLSSGRLVTAYRKSVPGSMQGLLSLREVMANSFNRENMLDAISAQVNSGERDTCRTKEPGCGKNLRLEKKLGKRFLSYYRPVVSSGLLSQYELRNKVALKSLSQAEILMRWLGNSSLRDYNPEFMETLICLDKKDVQDNKHMFVEMECVNNFATLPLQAGKLLVLDMVCLSNVNFNKKGVWLPEGVSVRSIRFTGNGGLDMEYSLSKVLTSKYALESGKIYSMRLSRPEMLGMFTNSLTDRLLVEKKIPQVITLEEYINYIEYLKDDNEILFNKVPGIVAISPFIWTEMRLQRLLTRGNGKVNDLYIIPEKLFLVYNGIITPEKYLEERGGSHD